MQWWQSLSSSHNKLLSTWHRGYPSQAKSRLPLTLPVTRLPTPGQAQLLMQVAARGKARSSGQETPRSRGVVAGWFTAASNRLTEAGKSGTRGGRYTRLSSPHPVPEQPTSQIQSDGLGARVRGHGAEQSVYPDAARLTPPPPGSSSLGGASVLVPPPGAPFPGVPLTFKQLASTTTCSSGHHGQMLCADRGSYLALLLAHP